MTNSSWIFYLGNWGVQDMCALFLGGKGQFLGENHDRVLCPMHAMGSFKC